MKFIKVLPICLLAIACMVVLIACSNGKSPVEPVLDVSPSIMSDLPEASIANFGNRSVLAVYDAEIDPINQTFTVTPSERELQYHGALTRLYPNCLTITDYGWSPNFWVDITLTHPMPGSGWIVFDPQVVAILPALSGVSFNYPRFDCVGNNKAVLEPDGYKKLYDFSGGPIPGNTNPFKAYFKDQPNRRWMDRGVTSETQRWQMNLSGMPVPFQYKLVVDICTNYPQLPTPGVDNSPEPVSIDTYIEQPLTANGGGSLIEVTLLDWQGVSDIRCWIESPDLFTGLHVLGYARPGPNPDEYVFSGTIANTLQAMEGEYSVLIAARDVPTGIYNFSEAKVTVIEAPYDGNLIWVKQAAGTAHTVGYAIKTLSDDSTVVTGTFDETTTFGSGELNETILTSLGGKDIFVARFNPDGTLAWAKRAGGSGYSFDSSFDLTVLPDNSTVVVGLFEDSITFGPGEPNQTVLATEDVTYNDIFIAKYNPNGTLAWAKRAGGVNSDVGSGITTLSDNSTVITGFFTNPATFGPGEPNETILTSETGFRQVFVARYNPDGTFLWAKKATGSGDGNGNEVTTLSDNSIVVTGGFKGTTIFGPGEANQQVLTSAGSSDIFIARYNPDGTLVWVKRAGGNNFPSLTGDEGDGITSLSDDSTVVTGIFAVSAIFGPGEPNQTSVSTGVADDSHAMFVARFNPNGTLAWAKHTYGIINSISHGEDVTSLSDDSTVVCGEYQGYVTFGFQEINERELHAVGSYDVFIARYDPDGMLAWVNSAGGLYEEYGYGITALSDDSSILTGLFVGSATFGPGESNQTTLTATGYYSMFLARYEP